MQGLTGKRSTKREPRVSVSRLEEGETILDNAVIIAKQELKKGHEIKPSDSMKQN